MNQISIILFPAENTLKYPTIPQCLEYIIQYLIRLGDNESMSERHEVVVLHGSAFVFHYRTSCSKLLVIYSLKGVQLLYVQLHEKCTYLNCTLLGVIDLS